MTEQFDKLNSAMSDPQNNDAIMMNALLNDAKLGKLICLHQMARTMIDIEKDLRRIEAELKKRKV